ncbi:uncharacterized protein [Diadema antillarum]|uniref:uncharacterized protein isoform X2 n=1 Tax=Diadema antillarum TaxID=105358 RepID=UPI003A85991A
MSHPKISGIKQSVPRKSGSNHNKVCVPLASTYRSGTKKVKAAGELKEAASNDASREGHDMSSTLLEGSQERLVPRTDETQTSVQPTDVPSGSQEGGKEKWHAKCKKETLLWVMHLNSAEEDASLPPQKPQQASASQCSSPNSGRAKGSYIKVQDKAGWMKRIYSDGSYGTTLIKVGTDPGCHNKADVNLGFKRSAKPSESVVPAAKKSKSQTRKVCPAAVRQQRPSYEDVLSLASKNVNRTRCSLSPEKNREYSAAEAVNDSKCSQSGEGHLPNSKPSNSSDSFAEVSIAKVDRLFQKATRRVSFSSDEVNQGSVESQDVTHSTADSTQKSADVDSVSLAKVERLFNTSLKHKAKSMKSPAVCKGSKCQVPCENTQKKPSHMKDKMRTHKSERRLLREAAFDTRGLRIPVTKLSLPSERVVITEELLRKGAGKTGVLGRKHHRHPRRGHSAATPSAGRSQISISQNDPCNRVTSVTTAGSDSIGHHDPNSNGSSGDVVNLFQRLNSDSGKDDPKVVLPAGSHDHSRDAHEHKLVTAVDASDSKPKKLGAFDLDRLKKRFSRRLQAAVQRDFPDKSTDSPIVENENSVGCSTLVTSDSLGFGVSDIIPVTEIPEEVLFEETVVATEKVCECDDGVMIEQSPPVGCHVGVESNAGVSHAVTEAAGSCCDEKSGVGKLPDGSSISNAPVSAAHKAQSTCSSVATDLARSSQSERVHVHIPEDKERDHAACNTTKPALGIPHTMPVNTTGGKATDSAQNKEQNAPSTTDTSGLLPTAADIDSAGSVRSPGEISVYLDACSVLGSPVQDYEGGGNSDKEQSQSEDYETANEDSDASTPVLDELSDLDEGCRAGKIIFVNRPSLHSDDDTADSDVKARAALEQCIQCSEGAQLAQSCLHINKDVPTDTMLHENTQSSLDCIHAHTDSTCTQSGKSAKPNVGLDAEKCNSHLLKEANFVLSQNVKGPPLSRSTQPTSTSEPTAVQQMDRIMDKESDIDVPVHEEVSGMMTAGSDSGDDDDDSLPEIAMNTCDADDGDLDKPMNSPTSDSSEDSVPSPTQAGEEDLCNTFDSSQESQAHAPSVGMLLQEVTDLSKKNVPCTPTKSGQSVMNDSLSPCILSQEMTDKLQDEADKKRHKKSRMDKLLKQYKKRERQASLYSQLKADVSQGGFIRHIQEKESLARTTAGGGTRDSEENDDERGPEVGDGLNEEEERIPPLHPGEDVFDRHKLRQVFTYCDDIASLTGCGFKPESPSALESLMLKATPDELVELVRTWQVEIAYHSKPCPPSLMLWMLKLMSVHRDCQVVKAMYDNLWSILNSWPEKNPDCEPFAPPVKDLVQIFVNYGTSVWNLLPADLVPVLFTEEDIRSLENKTPTPSTTNANDIPGSVMHEDELSDAEINRYYGNNLIRVVKILTQCLITMKILDKCLYHEGELCCIAALICKTALDKGFVGSHLQTDFSLCLAALFDCIPDELWNSMAQNLYENLPKVTEHHHNIAFLVQLVPCHTERGRYFSRQLAYFCLKNLCTPVIDTTESEEDTLKVEQLLPLLQACKPVHGTDLYKLNSLVMLIHLSVGNETLDSTEKDSIQNLITKLRNMEGTIRPNWQTKVGYEVKDYIIRFITKLEFMNRVIKTDKVDLFHRAVSQPEEDIEEHFPTNSQEEAASGSSGEEDEGEADGMEDD